MSSSVNRARLKKRRIWGLNLGSNSYRLRKPNGLRLIETVSVVVKWGLGLTLFALL